MAAESYRGTKVTSLAALLTYMAANAPDVMLIWCAIKWIVLVFYCENAAFSCLSFVVFCAEMGMLLCVS